MSNEFRKVTVDGKTVLIPVEHDPGHINPPLGSLNRAYMDDQAKKREDNNEIVDRVVSAVRQIPGGRRMQKPLAPHFIPKKAG